MKNISKKLPDCPPSSYASQTLKSYRFVFASPNHPHNFLPVLLINPQRKMRTVNAQCMGYGLSLYDNLTDALDRYKDAVENSLHAQKLGTHIAEGVIETSDGVVSPVNSQGHFTLHESEGADLASKFQIIMEAYHVGND